MSRLLRTLLSPGRGEAVRQRNSFPLQLVRTDHSRTRVVEKRVGGYQSVDRANELLEVMCDEMD